MVVDIYTRRPAVVAGVRQVAPVVMILLAFLLVGSLYAVYTPDWQAPDEPAHYNYVRQLAAGRWPVIEPGDYDEAYQREVISSGFASQYTVEPFEYEDYQPPLYYLLQTPLFLLFDGALRPLRLLSVLLGAGVVALAYAVAGQLFPGRPWLALTAAAFVAFLPQHVAMMAAVNNDSLAELLIAAILFFLLRLVVVGEEDLTQRRRLWPAKVHAKRIRKGIREQRLLIFLGVLLGLGFLTKVTVTIMAPVIGLGLAGRYWGQWRALGWAGLLVFGPAVLLGLPWWARNAAVYGGLDILGILAHNQVVVGQPRTAEWIITYGPAGTLGRFFQTTFQSFWGQFGWMGVVMKPWVYRPLLLLSLVAATGLGWALAGHRPASQARLPLAILASTFGLSLLLYLAYNATFVQHQGRYLFPALIPIALGVAVGLAAWLRPALARWPAAAYLLPAGLALALFGLDLFALFGFIVPALT